MPNDDVVEECTVVFHDICTDGAAGYVGLGTVFSFFHHKDGNA